MLYLLGVNLPDTRRVAIALTYIYGIGNATGESVCHRLGIHPRARLNELTEDQVTRLSQQLNTMKIEAELKREVSNRISQKVNMGCYQGIRHQMRLPVHGQRTRNNARTARRLNGRGFQKREYSR
ncbi:hypothetical protein BJ742DRAFT_812445 [Cladochytrium replicatum]|nr:hypothetical protein BJ742DRAFT_812445 [Cladochytrium replicatum]